MSKTLATLLDKPETIISAAINKLEDLAGYPSADVRLIAENHSKVRSSIKQLGLDEKDTTPEEFYYALLAKFEHDSREFADLLGLSGTQNPDRILRITARFINKSSAANEVWSLKNTSAKALLRTSVPRKLMKHLNYRSLDSMLKRENSAELIAALPAIESKRCVKTFWKAFSKLSTSDFELRSARIIIMTRQKWGEIKTPDAMVAAPHVGAVIAWSTPNVQRTSMVGLILDMLHKMSDLSVHSAVVGMHQFESSFAQNLEQVARFGLEPALKISNLPIAWKDILHILSDDSDDLLKINITNKPTNLLADFAPMLRWWSVLDHVGVLNDSRPISLNIRDVLHGYENGHDYGAAQPKHLSEHLWHELVSRYLEHPGVRNFVKAHLEGDNQSNVTSKLQLARISA